MPPAKRPTGLPSEELSGLLKKVLVLKLFEMGVPQGDIGKKLKMDIRAVNGFLKGIKRENAAKARKES